MSWCSASAVRFIGTQRPSIAIENDMSTSSATAARVRASVSTTSKSRMSSRMPSRRGRALVGRAGERVGHGAGDVPGLGVAELPLPGGAARLAGRARRAHVVGAGAVGQPTGDVAQQRLAELAHGLWRQAQLPSAARVR